MEPINILKARDNLSRLIARAARGEDVVISKHGRPVVRLVGVDDPSGHSASRLARWLADNPPGPGTRSPDELDEMIADERRAWD